MLAVAPLTGSPTPRVGTPPFGDRSRVDDIIAFAADLGVQLLPWQETLFDRSLRMSDGRYVHRTCLCVTARQSGKTTASGVRALAELVLWGGRLAVMAAQSRDVALESFRNAVELAEEADIPIERIRKATGSEEMILDLDGYPRLKVVSSTSGGGRGLSPDLVVWDELASMKTNEPYAALEKSRRARPNSQMFCITTEGTFESAVLNGLQEQGRAAAEAGRSDGIGYWEWSAHPDRGPEDRAGWQEANPAMGYLIDEATIADEQRVDPPEVFERETLCRRTTVERSWLPAGVWESTADRQATVPDSAVGQVALGYDASPDLSCASVAVAWERPDGRVHVELIATFTDTWSAESLLRELVAAWQPLTLGIVGKGPAEPVASRLAATTGVTVTALSGTDVDRAARSFYEATASRRLVHPADPVLAEHLASAQASRPGLFRLQSAGAIDVTGAVAAVLALWGVDRVPVTVAPNWVAW
jgi:hypothetical protein